MALIDAAAKSAHPRIAVIGGGIAGLAAGYRLTQLAPACTVTLIERERRLGGKIVTERVDGFTIEAGPDSFLAVKPRGIGLCRELGIEERLQGTDETTRGAFVMRRGRLHDLPEGLSGLVPTRLTPMAKTRLISPLGKARMSLDYLLPPRRDDGDESLAAFIQRRLGREVYERLVEPLMAGIYAGDGHQLSLAATFPQLRLGEREHGGLIKGILAAKRTAPPPTSDRPSSPFLTPRDGLGELIGVLEQRLSTAGVRIVTGSPVTNLTRRIDHFVLTLGNGEPITVDAVILATPAYATADLLDALVPDAARRLRQIPHVSTATVALGFALPDLPRPLQGHGYVIPRVEGRDALAVTWVSSKWHHRAPEGFALLRVFIGRAGQEEALAGCDDDLIALAQTELRDTLGINAQPAVTRVRRWLAGMPQYTLGHLDRVAAIDQALAAVPGLFVAGNAYRGVGIPDCIQSGETAAECALTPSRLAALSPQ